MPEILEVERYSRLARRVIGRHIVAVNTPDAWFIKGAADGEAIRNALVGTVVREIARVGKLLLVETGDATLGVRFGMTGRLFVDGVAGIDDLEYGSSRYETAWERFGLVFEHGSFVVHDPRRLGGVELEPDISRLGPDAYTLTVEALRAALVGARGPLKARLLDQSRIAGLGNLLTDETLWRARLDPRRVAGALTDGELHTLHGTIREVLDDLDHRGGSHTGDLQVAREPGAACPRCGGAIAHDQVGGRSTYWCGRCVT